MTVTKGSENIASRCTFELKDISFSDIGFESKLKSLPCRTGDFDQNKVIDYYVYNCNDMMTNCKSKAILMNADQTYTSSAILILNSPETVLLSEKLVLDRLKSLLCKLPSVDAIREVGDGDGVMNKIFTYDSTKKAFTEFSRCETVEMGE